MTARRSKAVPKLLLLSSLAATTGSLAQTPGATSTLTTTVRRVVVDVVVSDKQGHPIPGLTQDDFTLAEDGQPQKVLTFETNGFGQTMDYTPPQTASAARGHLPQLARHS